MHNHHLRSSMHNPHLSSIPLKVYILTSKCINITQGALYLSQHIHVEIIMHNPRFRSSTPLSKYKF